MTTVLFIEDQIALFKSMTQVLEDANFNVLGAQNGELGLTIAQNNKIDIAVIDYMLPKLSGIQIVKHLRSHGDNFPILMLTARAELEDKITGLNAGADDYLTKPFDIPELLARMHALLRRTTITKNEELIIETGALKINSRLMEVVHHGRKIKLTSREVQLLLLLIDAKNNIVTREHIQNRLDMSDLHNKEQATLMLVSRLRSKLKIHDKPNPVITVRGQGYRIKS